MIFSIFCSLIWNIHTLNETTPYDTYGSSWSYHPYNQIVSTFVCLLAFFPLNWTHFIPYSSMWWIRLTHNEKLSHRVIPFSFLFFAILTSSTFCQGLFAIMLFFFCRQELMDLVDRSGKFSKKFEGFTGKLLFAIHWLETSRLISELLSLLFRNFRQFVFSFIGTNDPLGKRLNNSKTRAEIGWEPKYASFAQFLGLSD